MKRKFSLLMLICMFLCAAFVLVACENKPKFTVTVEGGTGGGCFEQGTEITVVADEETEKRFLGWRIDGQTDRVSDEISYTFTVESDVKLIAEYVNVYTVSVVGGTGADIYDQGASVTVTANAAPEGKRFAGWSDGTNIVSEDEEYTFVVGKNVTLTAQYVNVYTVNVVGGTLPGNQTSGVFDEGTSVTVTAEIQNGKNFAGWNDGTGIVSTDSAYTFTVNKNVTLTATYIDLYTITVEGGTLPGGKTCDVFESGEEVTVTASVPSGKRFVKWTNGNGDELSADALYTFTVNGNDTLTAHYVNVYTVTVIGGTLPDNQTSDTFDENASVTVTANAGESEMTFGGWRLEGEAVYVSTDASYTFNVTEDVVLKAVYTCTVTVSNGTGGGTYDVGASVTVSVPDYAIAYDKEFDKWTDSDNEEKSSLQSYTFIAERNITLIPTFKTLTSFADKTEFTDTYTSDADFAAGSTIFSYPNGSGNIWKDQALSANSVLQYKECEITFDYTYADNYGSPITMVKVITGDYAFIHFANYSYSFITLQEKSFDNAGATPGAEAYALTRGVKYNVRLTVGQNHVTLFAKAETESEWTRVKTIGCVPTSSSLSLTSVNAAVDLQNLTVKSYFGKHAVTVEGGSIVSGCENGFADHKAQVVVTASETNDNGQPFIGWKIGEKTVSDEQSYTFVAIEDVVLTASYGFVVNVVNGTGGGGFASGASVTVIADESPNGHKFVGWFNGEEADAALVSEQANYTFTVTENVTLVAKFERDDALEEKTVKYTDNNGFTADSGTLFENSLPGYPSAELEYTIAYNETRTATTELKFTTCDITFDMKYTNMYAGGASFSVALGKYTFFLYCDGTNYAWFGTDAQDAADYYYSHPKETPNTGNVRYTITYTETSIALYAQRWNGTEYGEKELVRKIVFADDNVIEEYPLVFTANHCAVTLKDFTVTYYVPV